MLKGLNDFLDKHEGREIGSSTKAINKERVHQGYKAIKEKKHDVAKKMASVKLGKEKLKNFAYSVEDVGSGMKKYYGNKKGKMSLNSRGKNEGEHLMMGKNNTQRA
jgi:hypothetical protein